MEKVNIIEVGPRDGLQNESQVLSASQRVQFVQKLIACGARDIEVGSFVRADRIPQMENGHQVWNELQSSMGDLKEKVQLFFLVPNHQGLKRACEANINQLAFFTATSDSFNLKNIGMNVEKSLGVIDEMLSQTANHQVRLYLSTVFGCPYEGKKDFSQLKKLLKWAQHKNFYQISLGDTIGTGTPKEVKKAIEIFKDYFPLGQLALHLHDTYGMALTNIYAGLEEGVRHIDTSVGGLGGCPYAKGASGNVATEEVIYLCESLGLSTSWDLNKTLETSQWIYQLLNKKSPSKLDHAFWNKKNA